MQKYQVDISTGVKLTICKESTFWVRNSIKKKTKRKRKFVNFGEQSDVISTL